MANEKGTRGRRQTPGTGSVTKLPSGRHRWKFTTGKKTYSGTCDTELEADRMRAAMVVERNDALKAGKAPRPAEITLGAWVDAPDGWIDRREQQHLVRWSDKEHDRWDRYLKGSALASMPLRAIARPDVVAWVGEMLLRTRTRLQPPQPLARQTIANALNLLRKALGDAMEAGHLDANPAAGVKVPKRVGVMARLTPHLTIEEVRKVETTTAIPERARLVYVVALFGGFRQGELIGMRVGDVHLDGEAPYVAVNWSHSHGPKSGRAGEEVPMLPQTRDALRRILELRAADVAPEKLPADAHVFPSATSQQRAEGDDFGWASQKKGRQRGYVGHRERIGVNPMVTFHCLRHTFGTLAVEGSLTGEPMDLHHVQRFLRHADPKTTLRYAKMGTKALYDATAPKAPTEAPPGVSLACPSEGVPRRTRSAFSSSHPRDLNPRPTVYETVALPLS
ncbi:MAG: site-specific integrase [Myxococcaceae bacterium]|nr:site-specific integrase [Myxococcaceae bacterium]